MKRTLSIVLVFITLFSCSDEEENFEPGLAPEIPPVESMLINFDNFQEETNKGGREMSQLNWGLAAIQVGTWNVIITLNLAIPVAAFQASLTSTPEFDADRGLWVWRFDYDIVGRTYSSELTGQITEDGVEWQMFISEENGFQNFLWYTGTMNLDGTEGFWFLNENVDNPNALLRIHWEKESETIGRVKYSNVKVGAPNVDSFIEYGIQEGDLDRFYNISITSTENLTNIEWSKSTGEGRIKNLNFFKDEDFHCWDSSFNDIDCL